GSEIDAQYTCLVNARFVHVGDQSVAALVEPIRLNPPAGLLRRACRNRMPVLSHRSEPERRNEPRAVKMSVRVDDHETPSRGAGCMDEWERIASSCGRTSCANRRSRSSRPPGSRVMVNLSIFSLSKGAIFSTHLAGDPHT